MDLIQRDDVLPLDLYPLVLLTGKKHSGKKCVAFSYLCEHYNISTLQKKEVKIENHSYVYALEYPCVFSISYIDVFCNPQILFDFVFKRLYSESLFHQKNATFVCTDIHLCPKKWQIFIYKNAEIYPDIKVILSTESTSHVARGILDRFQIVIVPDIELFSPMEIDIDIQSRDIRNTVHNLLTNLIDSKEVLKVITEKLLDLPHINHKPSNVLFTLQSAQKCAQDISTCNEFYIQFIIETFLLQNLNLT